LLLPKSTKARRKEKKLPTGPQARRGFCPPWSEEEEASLRKHIKRHGAGKRELCKSSIPRRTARACREHWHGKLKVVEV
jgi:hypothetical protein